MANYYGVWRTNYFKVKDVEAFNEWAGKLDNVQVLDNGEGLVGLADAEDSDGGGIPSEYFDEEKEDLVEIDFAAELAEHLEPGWVAIAMESGSEKLRYVHGHAFAVNCEGSKKEIDIRDIHEMAEAMGEHVTDCQY